MSSLWSNNQSLLVIHLKNIGYSLDIAPILSMNWPNGCHDNNGYGHSLLTVQDVQIDTFIVVNNTSSLVYSLTNPIASKKCH